MAPPNVNVVVKNKVYSTPILNGDMETIATEIQAKKDEIVGLNSHLTDAIAILNDLQQQLIALYIQQTGSFPN